MKWIRERVIRREEIVLRRNQCGRAAEPVLSTLFISRLRESAHPAADDGVARKPVRRANPWSPLVQIGVRKRAGLAVHSGEQLCSGHLERASRQDLIQLLNTGVAGIR